MLSVLWAGEKREQQVLVPDGGPPVQVRYQLPLLQAELGVQEVDAVMQLAAALRTHVPRRRR